MGCASSRQSNSPISLSAPLFSPFKLGDLSLKNRVVMSALTRQRAPVTDGVPTALFADYYAARATAGLIITESIPVSVEANGYPGAGCLYNDEQEAGWKKVVDAVHKKGGVIFAQLFHGGRACFSADIGGL
jgi:N-ethylmaleimide reductase